MGDRLPSGLIRYREVAEKEERRQLKLARELAVAAEGNPQASLWIRWNRHQLNNHTAAK